MMTKTDLSRDHRCHVVTNPLTHLPTCPSLLSTLPCYIIIVLSIHAMASPNGPQQAFEGEQSLTSEGVYVSLTYDELDASKAMARVKSPKAGAVVLFAGTCTHLDSLPRHNKADVWGSTLSIASTCRLYPRLVRVQDGHPLGLFHLCTPCSPQPPFHCEGYP